LIVFGGDWLIIINYNNNWFNFISKLPSLINLMIKMENTSALKALNHSDVYNLKKEIPKDHK
jgi:hypothetical protein